MSVKPVVLLGGMLCNQRLWQGMLPKLAQRCQVQAIDLSLIVEPKAVNAALGDIVHANTHLAGFSLGGYQSLLHASSTSKLASLIVIASGGAAVKPAERSFRQRLIDSIDTGQQFDLMPLPQLRKNLASEPQARFQAAAQQMRAMAAEVGPRVLQNQLNFTLAQKDLKPRLANIQCPTLIIGGSRDKTISLEQLQALCDGIPNAELVMVPGSGHMLPLEAPDQVATIMNRFYDQLPTTMMPALRSDSQ